MIKTFEQFCADTYCKPVNEAFQSSKLRELIKQHGKPKYSWEKKMLYDLKDNEIIDVLNNRDEYYKKYSDKPDNSEATFKLELEDGTCVVISNLNILWRYWDLDKMEDEMRDVFKIRHAERHKGNLGKTGGDEIHKKHLENVNKIESKRFSEELQTSIPDIVKLVKDKINNIDIDVFDEGSNHICDNIILNGNTYGIELCFSGESTNERRYCGVELYDFEFYLTEFYIYSDEECEDDVFVSNDDLNITETTYGDLFEVKRFEDIEGFIYDYYAYYGVSPRDFI